MDGVEALHREKWNATFREVKGDINLQCQGVSKYILIKIYNIISSTVLYNVCAYKSDKAAVHRNTLN